MTGYTQTLNDFSDEKSMQLMNPTVRFLRGNLSASSGPDFGFIQRLG